MKILVVNDDSIHAPGIAMLAKAALELTDDVWVVAPDTQCSALSQKLTLRETLPVKRFDGFPVPVRQAWQLGGTPVDCVKVAMDYVLKGKPDVVLSGINNGYNVGFDIAYSGTAGAAFEAARHGIHAIAVSAASDKHLAAAEPYLTEILRELVDAPLEPGEVWNVNFPAMSARPLQGIRRDVTAARVSMYQENYVETVNADGSVELTCKGTPTTDDLIGEGTDAQAVRRGYISIGRIRAF